MPEEWNQIAFDDHVHDANTKGRKSPTHLIMDAWIKGIRRLRVIYYNHISSISATELLQAAEIMGITVRIGIEFSARFRGKYVGLIWVPRGFHDAQDFLCFLEEPEVEALMLEGRVASRYQEKRVLALLGEVNKRHRHAIREKYKLDLPELEESDFRAYVAPGQASALHLARYLHAKIVPLLSDRVEALRQDYQSTHDADEQRRIQALVDELNHLTADAMMDEYLDRVHNPDIANPEDSNPEDSNKDEEIPWLLRLDPKNLIDHLVNLRSGYRLTLNLTGLQVEDVLEILYAGEGRITRLEIFNLKDHSAGLTGHVPAIAEMQQAVNQGNVIALKSILRRSIQRLSLEDPPDASRIEQLRVILHDIITLKAFYTGTRLTSRIGSDSTGGSPRTYGMGLVVEETLPQRARRQIDRPNEARLRLPIAVQVARQIVFHPRPTPPGPSRLMNALRRLPGCGNLGLRREKSWQVHEYATRLVPHGNIITLGGIRVPELNGLDLKVDSTGQRGKQRMSNMNNFMKNSLKVLLGFIPAFATFALTKQWWLLAYGGAFIWFGITGLRNVMQSVLGGGGLRRSPLLRWNDLISWQRITDSLLFTGFSVPLLDYVTKTVILDRGMGITTATHPIMLYSLMALANGIYLSSHNILRGLPRGAVVGNFFRSILSIPLAVGFNAAAGMLLTSMRIRPVDLILQRWAAIISKAASDVVAGIIEGLADRFQNIERRRNALKQIIRQTLDTYADLELLLPEAQVMEYLKSPEKWEGKIPADVRDLAKRMFVHALDLLYFWMYQPRARIALRSQIRTLSPEERDILLQAQIVLRQERPISQMFVDGILGKGFAEPLAFYLSQAPAYLAAVDKLITAEKEN